MPDTDRGEGIGRTILLSQSLSEVESILRERGLNVIVTPRLVIQPPQSLTTLDEAIENLFGYDWLICVNEDAGRFFLDRVTNKGHDLSELDSLHVCAVGEGTASVLEQSPVHVDVIATNAAGSVIDQIANYVGGRESLQRLNFLIPQASIGRDYLIRDLQEADARADVVIAYQTVSAIDMTRLSVLQSLLLTGSVDAVALTNDKDVADFARLFDTHDLGRLLSGVTIFVPDQRGAMMAAQMGVSSSLISVSSSEDEMVDAIIKRLPI